MMCMKNNDKIARTHKGMLLCLWDAIALENASTEHFIKHGGERKHSDAIKKVIDKIVSMPDYTYVVGQADRLKIDNETHIRVYFKNIFYKGKKLFTIYMSKTSGNKCLIDSNINFLMTNSEKAEMRDFDSNVDKFLQSITSTQNRLIENS